MDSVPVSFTQRTRGREEGYRTSAQTVLCMVVTVEMVEKTRPFFQPHSDNCRDRVLNRLSVDYTHINHVSRLFYNKWTRQYVASKG